MVSPKKDKKDSNQLQKWFNSLASRTLDLVGDYAGRELFLIEGDSILLQCFCDKTVDFSNGLQLLHVTYLVERFLCQLHRRKCMFEIVFFEDHGSLCIPENSSPHLRTKYQLAREAILQHLLHNLADSTSSTKIHIFKSYQCSEFEEYLNAAGAYFLICHDGSILPIVEKNVGNEDLVEDSDVSLSDDEVLALSDPADRSNEEVSEVSPTKIILRSMMHWFIVRGYNISIINSLECRDSKVFSIILEGSSSSNQGLDESINSLLASCQQVPPYHANIDERIPGTIWDVAREQESELTQREWLTVIVLGLLRAQHPFHAPPFSLESCAMIMHISILSECRLTERAVTQKRPQDDERFLLLYSKVLREILKSAFWQEFVKSRSSPCDLADLLDGSLFLETLRVLTISKATTSFGFSVLQKARLLNQLIIDIFNFDFLSQLTETKVVEVSRGPEHYEANRKILQLGEPHGGLGNEHKAKVLPFSNTIIDAHLKSVCVVTEECAREDLSLPTSRIFQELSHWHNHKRPLNKLRQRYLNSREESYIMRRDQLFMKDVISYAASLTNPSGGLLKPEIVCVRPQETKSSKPTMLSKTEGKKKMPEASSNHNVSLQRRPGGKATKISVREQIAASQLQKKDQKAEKHLVAWQSMVKNFETQSDYSIRFMQVKRYLEDLPSDRKSTVEPEVLAYMTSTLILLWMDKCRSGSKKASMTVAARIWQIIQRIAKAKEGVSNELVQFIKATIKVLKLPKIELSTHVKQKLSFEFADLRTSTTDLSIGLSPSDFQLLQAGPYMDRAMGSAPDHRVYDFEPDKWQREVLDQIDARGSLFVVAPTSAGKTFISFYAIKQILEDDDEGVLVYVAPTKALVNQIAAEIQARFSKSFNDTPGKSVWAIHTRDYRINNSTGCQVLITVPHVLQIMLLSPSNAKSWSPRIRRIIFDEVHCIGQADDGVVWEQLLLLAPCPIIALSATVGNPIEFTEWLELAQKANGLNLRMIQHKTRYSDLRKFVYLPPRQFVFNGLAKSPTISPLGLDESPNMAFLHPIASLIDRSRGMPGDLSLEPRDCLLLWKAMTKYATDDFPIGDHLNPVKFFPVVVKKADVVEWETKLKDVLKEWMSNRDSPFEAVIQELSKPLSAARPEVQVSGKSSEELRPSVIKEDDICETTLPLICSLHDQDALPALFFNYDRENCEKICYHLLQHLEEAEQYWKENNSVWQTKVAKFEMWQKAQDKQVSIKQPKCKSKRQADNGNERISQLDLAREAGSKESSAFESFNPNDPIRGFHFADETKLTASEFADYRAKLKRWNVSERLISALQRGIGVHHAGLNRKYRQICEILFRKGYLRVVIATGTLALGINMPCKTVVFSGDSVYLTALNFRQAAGRAGRRGFDFLGNVVFQGLSHQKVCRLLSSKLPDLNGHFPITTSLILRLFILLQESKQAPYAVRAVNSILSCPRIYLGGPELKDAVLHHLRFSIEYLRRNWLLDRQGSALNFAGLVAHLYYTENSSFAFHALLSGGYFHEVCQHIYQKPKQTIRALMLVMSHLFGRRILPLSPLESRRARKKSASLVVLPRLPTAAAGLLATHNERTLGIYSTYVATFVEQHVHESDSKLPFTGLECGGLSPSEKVNTSMSFLEPTKVRSPFIALSGHRDDWKSISELCSTVRNGIWLEQSAIPHIPVSTESDQPLLNAYLYDFIRHGNVQALEHENMIRKGDLWFWLNDFSLVLATIVTTLENFLKLNQVTADDMTDILGSGDRVENVMDDEILGSDEHHQDQNLELIARGSAQQPIQSVPYRPTSNKGDILDNWDDNTTESDEEDRASQSVTENPEGKNLHLADTDDAGQGQGLLRVLHAFKMLQSEFDEKFKAMWA